ncbi:MAG: acylphosphatase [Candidatus Woesearchaeota archaeon]
MELKKKSKTIKFLVYGYVQGVNYRAFVKRLAEELSITGYVRNLDDGSVEILANISEDKLSYFLMKLYEGSTFSKVRNVQFEEIPYQEFKSFEIK